MSSFAWYSEGIPSSFGKVVPGARGLVTRDENDRKSLLLIKAIRVVCHFLFCLFSFPVLPSSLSGSKNEI